MNLRHDIVIGRSYVDVNNVPVTVSETTQSTITFMKAGVREYCTRQQFCEDFNELGDLI